MTISTDEAKALVTTQLYTTQLECETSILLEYTDILDRVIEALALKDPRYVYRHGEAVFVDEAIVEGYLQIELIDFNLDDESHPEHHWIVDGDELDTTKWRLDDITLGFKLSGVEVNPLPAYIEVEQVDYVTDTDQPDREDFKFKRTYLVNIRLLERPAFIRPAAE